MIKSNEYLTKEVNSVKKEMKDMKELKKVNKTVNVSGDVNIQINIESINASVIVCIDCLINKPSQKNKTPTERGFINITNIYHLFVL